MTSVGYATGLGQIELETKTVQNRNFAITHLPQIAACGDQHYLVYKQSDNNRTYTDIKSLEMSEREQMIATMMSGENRTESAVAAAREMLKSMQVKNNQQDTL